MIPQFLKRRQGFYYELTKKSQGINLYIYKGLNVYISEL